jgi:DDE superfamily endonuclease
MAHKGQRSMMPSVQVKQAEKQARVWADGLGELHERIGPRFGRIEPRRRALGYLQGLLGEVERKNSWWLAEQAGEQVPDGMQRLLNGSGWDADGVRDDVQDYVIEQLGDRGAVLVLDETGFVKKGTRSAGVARQYTGTAGRIENAQVGVFLAYASPAGVTLIDRDLYLPKAWTDDRARCRAAGIDDAVPFQTKPQLGQAILERALAARVPFGWVTGDTVYGGDRSLRVWLEQHAIRHVMAVKRTEPLLTMTDRGPDQVPAERLLTEIGPSSGCDSTPPMAPRASGCTTGSECRCTASDGRQRRLLAAGPPLGQRPQRAGLLCLLRPGRHLAGHPGPGCRLPLAGRGGL